MAGAARKSKLTKYEVTVKRQMEHVAVVEVEARSAEEACDIANNVIDDGSTRWNEGDIICQDAKAKVIRGG